MTRIALLALVALTACTKDETIHAYGAGERTYALQSVNGVAFEAQATLSFPEPGQVSGQGPCNSFSASQNVPYPWFELGPILSTKRACADLDAESRYFLALSNMSLGRVQDNVLTLSNDAEDTMIFKEVPAASDDQ